MKLQRFFSRRVAKKSYWRFIVQLAPSAVAQLGWKDGDELVAVVVGQAISLQHQDPRPTAVAGRSAAHARLQRDKSPDSGGVPPLKPSELLARVRELNAAGKTDLEIASAFPASVSWVNRIRNRAGIPRVPGVARPRRWSFPVQAAEELYHKGLADGKIAAALGVSRKTIWAWRAARGLQANGSGEVGRRRRLDRVTG